MVKFDSVHISNGNYIINLSIDELLLLLFLFFDVLSVLNVSSIRKINLAMPYTSIDIKV